MATIDVTIDPSTVTSAGGFVSPADKDKEVCDDSAHS